MRQGGRSSGPSPCAPGSPARAVVARAGVAPRITSDTPSGPMNLINAVVAATAFSIVDGIGKVRLSSP